MRTREGDALARPFKIGVIQLTIEPVREMVAFARALDEAGFDTLWLGEAHQWWRKHSLEGRSSTALSALMARETTRLGLGWGIISPYARHPVQIAMEARVLQEVAGEGRFSIGLGPSKGFMETARIERNGNARPLTAIREAVAIIRGALGGEAFSFEGKEFAAQFPPLAPDADAPRWNVPVYVAGTAPKIQQAAGEVADGLLTASITTPAFARYARGNMEEGARRAGRDPGELDLGCVIVSSIGADRASGREGAREIAAMYLANKVQNIKGAAEVLLEKAQLTPEEILPVAQAMELGGRKAAARAVTDSMLDKVKPVAGTPSDCIEAIEEYRDAGCTQMMLELWGDDRLEQVELFRKHVLPHFKAA
jgi:5,10-methylenetetrahydromethanopterin reductase